MTSARSNDHAGELQREFDGAFALPAALSSERRVEIVMLRISAALYAMRVAELAGIVAVHKIVPIPTSAPGMLGLAGVRGAAVPVYGMSQLLGHAPNSALPRWIALARAHVAARANDADRTHDVTHFVGFAFDELDEYVGLHAGDFAPVQANAGKTYVTETAKVGAELRAVVSLYALVEHIKAQRGGLGKI